MSSCVGASLVAQALCWAVPDAPASDRGAVVTHVFTGPEIQQIRRDGKLGKIVSPELRWDGVDETRFRYSFKLWLYPNSEREEDKGAVGLFWELTYGPDGDQRAWPMPYERSACQRDIWKRDHHRPSRTLGKPSIANGAIFTNASNILFWAGLQF
eukprot:2791046-Amphidinium_carterae.1